MEEEQGCYSQLNYIYISILNMIQIHASRMAPFSDQHLVYTGVMLQTEYLGCHRGGVWQGAHTLTTSCCCYAHGLQGSLLRVMAGLV